MLIQFAVENFLSFQAKTVLNLTATADPKHPSHLRPVNKAGNLQALRCAAVYGANASGKSNLVKALAFAKKLVTEGTRPGASIGVTPFRLQHPVQPDARFEFEIWTEQTRYSYGFVVSSKEVRQEWLYRTKGTKEQLCFERESNDNGKVGIKLGKIFGPAHARVEFVAEGTRPEQLFLTEAEERNVTELKSLSEYFRSRLGLISPESICNGLSAKAESSAKLRSFLGQQLQAAGTGITSLTTRRRRADLPEQKAKRVQESLNAPRRLGVRLSTGGKLVDVVRGQQEGSLDEIRLLTQRTLANGQKVDFELEEESDGTRRLLDLLPLLFAFNEEGRTPTGGAVIFIDELERSLHPLLTRQFLQNFLATSTSSNTQLLFTPELQGWPTKPGTQVYALLETLLPTSAS